MRPTTRAALWRCRSTMANGCGPRNTERSARCGRRAISVFFVTDLNELVRLDSDTGQEIWKRDLPGYEPKRNPNRRRDGSFANHGPVLAGGRLIVASTDGKIRAFNPADGALVQEVAIPGGATTRPVVAGGTLYVVSRKGVLHAFR